MNDLGRPAGTAAPSPAAVIALNSQTLRAPDLVHRLDAAHRAGFNAVELTGEELDRYLETPDLAAELLADRSLHLLGVCPAPDLTVWHHAWSRDLARTMRQRLTVYRALGARYLVLPFMTPAGNYESSLRGLGAAAEIAQEVGIGLAVESIGHVPKLRRLEETRALIQAVPAPPVGLALDSFHFFRAGHTSADLDLLDGITVWVTQLSNAVDKPLVELVGYRDRTFPLDGIFDIADFCSGVTRWAPGSPLAAEVMGDVPWALDPDSAAGRAHTQLAALTDLRLDRETA